MKLKRIHEEITNYQGSFVLHPSLLTNNSEIDFADKLWELDFLNDLTFGEKIVPTDLTYTEKNRAKNLITAGFVFFKGGKYLITDLGKVWFEMFNDAKNTITKSVTAGNFAAGAMRGLR